MLGSVRRIGALGGGDAATTPSAAPPTPKYRAPEAPAQVGGFLARATSGVRPHQLRAGKDAPINIAYLTTLSELAGDEKVGSIVVDPETGQSFGRRVGNLEHLASALKDPDSPLHGRFELVGIAFDDDRESAQAFQTAGVPWPWEIDVPTRGGALSLRELAFNVPSRDWRAVKDPQARIIAKADYEARIVAWLDSIGADLVVSDSYTRIVGPTLLEWMGTQDGASIGRGLNIHPAIAAVDDPRRLPGITPTRDAYTRARHGYVIIDDKKAVDLPEGERINVTYEGKERQAVRVQTIADTGVTVHVIAPRVDNGAPVAVLTAELPDAVTYEGIRAFNYTLKKTAMISALLDYSRDPAVRQIIDAGRKARR